MFRTSRFLFVVAVVIAATYIAPAVVHGAVFNTHVTFNDGLSDTLTKDCTASEFRTVVAAVTNATVAFQRRGRNLRLTKDASSSASHQRELARICGCRLCVFSGRGCAGKTTGEECEGDCDRRRSRRGLAAAAPRDLQTNTTTTPCDAEMVVINATLNTVVNHPNITTKCRALLNSKRTFTCRRDLPCDIAQISVWDTVRQTMITNHTANGVNVCASAKPTIDAIPVFNLGHVDFRLDGVSSNGTIVTHYKREWHAPFVMFGNSGPYYNGMKEFTFLNDLPVGSYTIKVYVEDIANSKIIKMNVTNC